MAHRALPGKPRSWLIVPSGLTTQVLPVVGLSALPIARNQVYFTDFTGAWPEEVEGRSSKGVGSVEFC